MTFQRDASKVSSVVIRKSPHFFFLFVCFGFLFFRGCIEGTMFSLKVQCSLSFHFVCFFDICFTTFGTFIKNILNYQHVDKFYYNWPLQGPTSTFLVIRCTVHRSVISFLIIVLWRYISALPHSLSKGDSFRGGSGTCIGMAVHRKGK